MSKIPPPAPSPPAAPSPRRLVALLLAAGLIAVILGRLLAQTVLYRSGYEGFDPDEYIRVFKAVWWTESDRRYLSRGPLVNWLPLHAVLLGSALAIKPDLLLAPRAAVFAIGLASILVMYRLARELFDDRTVGFVSAVFLAANPAHIWFSSTTLSEIPYSTLILLGLLYFARCLTSRSSRDMYLSAACLGLAGGFRYEGWVIAAIFSLCLAVRARGEIRRPNGCPWAALGAAFLPWLFPAAWMIFNARVAGHPLSFVSTSFAVTKYFPGAGVAAAYWRALTTIDPYAVFLFLPGLAVAFGRYRGRPAVRWYLAVAVIPLIFFILQQGGRVTHDNSFLRQRAPYVFLAYPAVALAAVALARALARSVRARAVLLALMVALVVSTQVRTALSHELAHRSYGVKVGETVGRLWAGRRADAPRVVLLEDDTVWRQLFAIRIGANDLVSDYIRCPGPDGLAGLLAGDAAALREFIRAKRVSLIIVATDALRAALEEKIGLSPSARADGCALYLVPGG